MSIRKYKGGFQNFLLPSHETDSCEMTAGIPSSFGNHSCTIFLVRIWFITWKKLGDLVVNSLNYLHVRDANDANL